MKRSLLCLIAVAVMMLGAGTMAKADSITLDFVYQNGGLPYAPVYGTVTASITTSPSGCSAGCIEFDLTAASGYAFHMGTGGDTFAWNLDPDATISLVGAPAGWALDSGANMDGFGSGVNAFEWGLDTGSGAGTATSLTFYITKTGGFSSITDLEDLNSGGSGDVYMAAFMTPLPTGTGCTGYVGTNGGSLNWPGTSGTNVGNSSPDCGGTSVPEPSSPTLLGAGLFGLGVGCLLLKRKVSSAA